MVYGRVKLYLILLNNRVNNLQKISSYIDANKKLKYFVKWSIVISIIVGEVMAYPRFWHVANFGWVVSRRRHVYGLVVHNENRIAGIKLSQCTKSENKVNLQRFM